jgi:hypothetical protein
MLVNRMDGKMVLLVIGNSLLDRAGYHHTFASLVNRIENFCHFPFDCRTQMISSEHQQQGPCFLKVD